MHLLFTKLISVFFSEFIRYKLIVCTVNLSFTSLFSYFPLISSLLWLVVGTVIWLRTCLQASSVGHGLYLSSFILALVPYLVHCEIEICVLSLLHVACPKSSHNPTFSSLITRRSFSSPTTRRRGGCGISFFLHNLLSFHFFARSIIECGSYLFTSICYGSMFEFWWVTNTLRQSSELTL